MEKTGVVVDGDIDVDGDWLTCDEMPCNEVHLVLAWASFMFCTHAVAFSTMVGVWLTLTPTAATSDFFWQFPRAIAWPARSMMLGVACWAIDATFLAVVKHGTNLMLWLIIPAFALAGHVGYMFFQIRHFNFQWSKTQPCK